MKISRAHDNNTVIKAPNSQNVDKEIQSSSSRKDKKQTSNVIYAGDLNMNNDAIANKNQKAKKDALKAIMDQFKKDKKVDDNIEELNRKKEALEKDAKMASDQINDLNVKKQDLMKTYGITDDSQEQKDLVLLEKSIFSPKDITEDDYTQLEKMGPLTDYQKESLKYTAMQEIYKNRAENAANGISGIKMSVSSIKLSLLKTHPMVDAQNEAMKIIENAIKEVLGDYMEQGKENIDKKTEENEEKIEKGQKEQEKKEANSSTSNNLSLTTSEQTDQLQLVDDIKKLAVKQNMLDEDIKGLEVDEQI